MPNLFAPRIVETVLLVLLLMYMIADACGTFGITYGPAWVLFSVYSVHSRAPRSLTISILVGASSVITDLIYFGVVVNNKQNGVSAGAITFAVCVRSTNPVFPKHNLTPHTQPGTRGD